MISKTRVFKPAFLVLILSIVLNSIGQILFKAARIENTDTSLLSQFLNIKTLLGFFLYGLSAICWLWVLSRTQLSLSYPVLALSFPIVVALSGLFFGEAITTLRWLGVVVIVLGVSLLAKT